MLSIDSSGTESLIQKWAKSLQSLTDLVLPTDYPRPLPHRIVEAEHVVDITEAAALAILKWSIALPPNSNVSPFTILLSAFAVLLHKYTGEEDISIGSSSATSNPLVLRLNVSDELTMIQVIQHVLQVRLSLLYMSNLYL